MNEGRLPWECRPLGTCCKSVSIRPGSMAVAPPGRVVATLRGVLRNDEEKGAHDVSQRASKSATAGKRSRAQSDFLDKVTLVQTAAEVADRVGWSDLTLSEVAREVDRHVTSLYAHIEGLDDLRREITLLALDEMSDAVWRATLGHVREDALREIARVLRTYCGEHPARAASVVLTKHGSDPEQVSKAERLAEPIRATLRSFGLTEKQVFHAHRVFSASIWGFTQGEGGELFPEGGVDETFDQLLELFFLALNSGKWPVERKKRSGSAASSRG
jgi:AcrR family transcriptional regulator